MNNAAEVVNKGGSQSTTSATTQATPDVPTNTAPTTTTSGATFLLQATGETALSPCGLSRLDSSAHAIERMLNQNTYDDIAQGMRKLHFSPDLAEQKENIYFLFYRF